MPGGTKTRAPIYNMPRVPVSDEVALAQEFDLGAEIAASADADMTVLLAAFILLGILYAVKYILVPLIKLLSPSGGSLINRVVNWLISEVTAPVKFIIKWTVHQIVVGIEAHSRPFARTIESWAWEIHDYTTVVGNFARATTTAMAHMRTRIIPRIVTAQLVPVKRRVKTLETVRAQLDAIARQYGYSSFPVLVKTATPHIKQLVAADVYVQRQGHASLAGALSVYEQAAKSWTKTQTEVRKLGYYTIPDFIRHTDTQIEKVIKPQLKKQELAIGKITKLLSPDAWGIPVLLAAMTPAAIGRFIRPAIPNVCTEVGECAAGNLLGSSLWRYFKDLLGLLLALTIGAFALEDLCGISKLCIAVVGEIEPEIRSLVVVSGGIASIGCASPGNVLPPPAY